MALDYKLVHGGNGADIADREVFAGAVRNGRLFMVTDMKTGRHSEIVAKLLTTTAPPTDNPPPPVDEPPVGPPPPIPAGTISAKPGDDIVALVRNSAASSVIVLEPGRYDFYYQTFDGRGTTVRARIPGSVSFDCIYFGNGASNTHFMDVLAWPSGNHPYGCVTALQATSNIRLTRVYAQGAEDVSNPLAWTDDQWRTACSRHGITMFGDNHYLYQCRTTCTYGGIHLPGTGSIAERCWVNFTAEDGSRGGDRTKYIRCLFYNFIRLPGDGNHPDAAQGWTTPENPTLDGVEYIDCVACEWTMEDRTYRLRNSTQMWGFYNGPYIGMKFIRCTAISSGLQHGFTVYEADDCLIDECICIELETDNPRNDLCLITGYGRAGTKGLKVRNCIAPGFNLGENVTQEGNRVEVIRDWRAYLKDEAWLMEAA